MPATGARLLWRTIATGLLAAVTAAGAQASERDLHGMVCDGDRPVSSARVAIAGTDAVVRTDANGRFSIAVPRHPAAHVIVSADGYYIGGSDVPQTGELTIQLRPHPAIDSNAYEWVSPFAKSGAAKACENCHADPDDGALLLFGEWSADSHARSATNPRFLSMYRGSDIAGHRSAPSRFLSRPDYGRVPIGPDPQAPHYGPGFELDNPDRAGNCASCHVPVDAVSHPYGSKPTEASPRGREGITCDFCHKISAVRLSGETGRPYPNTPGVLSFEFRRPAGGDQFFAGPLPDVDLGSDVFSPLYSRSAYCAPCHHGEFWSTLVYDSFGEWLASPYANPKDPRAATCQQCHMPPSGTDHAARISEGARLRAPSTVASHRMLGAADEAFVAGAAALMVNARAGDNSVDVRVETCNVRAGHHLPTDSPLRHLILVIKAADRDGGPLKMLSGPTLPDWVSPFSGRAGRVYAKVLRDAWSGEQPTASYWRPVRIVSDSRIPALASDVTEYRFEARPGNRVTIEAELWYRRAFRDLASLKQWEDPDILMASTTIVLQLPDAASTTPANTRLKRSGGF